MSDIIFDVYLTNILIQINYYFQFLKEWLEDKLPMIFSVLVGFVGNCVEGDVIIVVLLDFSFITTLNGTLISLVSRPT